VLPTVQAANVARKPACNEKLIHGINKLLASAVSSMMITLCSG
jgi:hypothetical protein